MLRIGLAALLIGTAIGSGSWLFHRKIIDATGLYAFGGDPAQLTHYNAVLFLLIDGKPVPPRKLRLDNQLKDVVDTYNQLLQRLSPAQEKSQA